ncbi:IST1-like protein [Morella rubra]|uniref:IST1-like protein n=1 Tax=Morella rubra TaxID=262757 RepID=A0A6A1W733_9ROSI|nr:IST1-like protein [Morella rubra]
MGKKLYAFFGRSAFKASKFNPLVNLSISRLAVLKNQRLARCSVARSDVVQLLELGHHECALLRVEHVIKEQNMFDVFVMMEGYCNLLIERVNLIEQERECPVELKEAISSMIYASSRCGEFPELLEIRNVLTSRFGKEFAARAIELRNDCGVNPKMIQKLSTKQPDLESRMKVLKEIASENNIVLRLEEPDSISAEENSDVNKKQNQTEPGPSVCLDSNKHGDNLGISCEEKENLDDGFKARRKYKDVADAAQAAFESAACAAAAARAAVELSRSEPHTPGDHDSPKFGRGKANSQEIGRPNSKLVSGETRNVNEKQAGEMKQKKNVEAELKRSISISSSDSAEDIVYIRTISSDLTDQVDPFEKSLHFDESDIESTVQEQSRMPSHKQIPSGFQAGLKGKSVLGHPLGHVAEASGMPGAQRLNIERRPISARTRQVRGY